MKRKAFLISLASIFAGLTLPSYAAKRRNNRNKNNRNRKKKKKPPIVTEEKKITFSGTLTVDGGSYTVSGNKIPLDIDGGMAFRIKKLVGQTVKVEGTKITKNKKTFIRVKFISPA